MRFSKLALTMALSLALSTMAFATEDANLIKQFAGGELLGGQSELTVEVVEADAVIIATVPVEIPFVVDTFGNVTAPTNAVMENNTEDKTIKVDEVKWHSENTLKTIDSNKWTYEDMVDFTKGMALNINNSSNFNAAANAEGIIDDYFNPSSGWNIEPGKTLPLEFEAYFSKDIWENVSDKQTLGTLSFVISIVE